MKPKKITITVKQLEDFMPCDESKQVWPRELLRDGKMTVLWTADCAIMLARADEKGPQVGALCWLESRRLVPRVLTGTDLRGKDLTECNFDSADFRKSDLRDVSFKYSYTNFCDFRGADMRGTVISNYYGCKFDGAKRLPTDTPIYGYDLNKNGRLRKNKQY